MAIAVTDDELVAAVVRAGRTWDGLLPSLDLNTEGVLVGAALRGIRSLAVRGLLADDEFTDAALELGRLATGSIVVRAFSAARVAPLVPLGPGITLVVSGSEALIDLTGANGTHDIAPMGSADEAWLALHNVLLVVVERGIGEDRVLTVLAANPEPGTGVAVIATHESVQDCDVTFDAEGRPVVTTVLTGDLDEAERRVRALWEAQAAPQLA